MKKIIFLFIFLIFTPNIASAAQPIIHVGILRNVTKASIGANGFFEVSYSKTGNISYYNHPIVIKIKDKSLYVDTKKMVSKRITMRSENNRLMVNDRNYRGTLEIVNNAPESFTVIELLTLDEYLYGIIKHEISHKWPQDAIKAQVVAARTYTLKSFGKHGKEGFDLCTTTCCQVYGGLDSEDPVSNKYVDETSGEILTYKGEPVTTPYHGFCGGHSEEPRFVWEGSQKVPYLKSKRCPYCKKAPRFSWTVKYDRAKIESILSAKGFAVGKIASIKVTKRSPSGRAIEMKISHKDGKISINAYKFRLMMGADIIRSTNFKLKKEKDTYVFTGTGWGHGVGLCQEGARGMAERGYSYKKILQFYYPGTELVKWGL